MEPRVDRLEALLGKPRGKAKVPAIEDKKESASQETSSDSDSSSSSSSDSQAAKELQFAKGQLEEKTAEAKALKSDFENIFTALCHASAELKKAKESPGAKSNNHQPAENALLRQQLQRNHEEIVEGNGESIKGSHEEIVEGNGDAPMTPMASDGSLMAPMASDGTSSTEPMGSDFD